MENNDLKKVNGYYVNKKNVGNRIFRIRNNRNDTLEEFGKLFDAAKSVVLRWENGSSLPNKSRIEKIAKKGNITVNELLYGSIEEFVNNNDRLLIYKNNPVAVFFDTDKLSDKINSAVHKIKAKGYTIEDIDKIVAFANVNFFDMIEALKKLNIEEHVKFAYQVLEDDEKIKIISLMLEFLTEDVEDEDVEDVEDDEEFKITYTKLEDELKRLKNNINNN